MFPPICQLHIQWSVIEQSRLSAVLPSMTQSLLQSCYCDELKEFSISVFVLSDTEQDITHDLLISTDSSSEAAQKSLVIQVMEEVVTSKLFLSFIALQPNQILAGNLGFKRHKAKSLTRILWSPINYTNQPAAVGLNL